MPQYLSPGVYVEEVPSAVQAIAGVGTSTAGFIGIMPGSFMVPAPNPYYNSALDTDDSFNDKDIEVVPSAAKLVGITLADGTLVANREQADAVVEAVKQAGKTRIAIKNTSHVQTTMTLKTLNDDPTIVKLCTNFAEFKNVFGDFSDDPGQRLLAHAVFGFFHNGGTRCYVARIADEGGIQGVLDKFGAVDEIALVAAPGVTSQTARSAIVAHCAVATQDRFAILDSDLALPNDDLTLLDPSNAANVLPDNSDYAAFYFPWIQVFDPATRLMNPKGANSDGLIFVPPSGHVAGIYARTDTTRGVHKAPANVAIMGALGVRYPLSKAHQDGLNPQGVNCIRDLNGNIRVWGARTIGGNANGEWRYINVRRTFLFLRESIDEGLQWAVFEPNDQNLWAKITLNVSAFLTTVWRSGALFGSTAAEAFYVKCDAETNPPALREVGQVVTEIGVAVVRPAEFVIFRISQWQPQKGG